jgi:hypothetical protein
MKSGTIVPVPALMFSSSALGELERLPEMRLATTPETPLAF